MSAQTNRKQERDMAADGTLNLVKVAVSDLQVGDELADGSTVAKVYVVSLLEDKWDMVDTAGEKHMVKGATDVWVWKRS